MDGPGGAPPPGYSHGPPQGRGGPNGPGMYGQHDGPPPGYFRYGQPPPTFYGAPYPSPFSSPFYQPAPFFYHVSVDTLEDAEDEAAAPAEEAPIPYAAPAAPEAPVRYGVPEPDASKTIDLRANDIEEEEIAEALDPVEESKRHRRRLVLQRLRALRARGQRTMG